MNVKWAVHSGDGHLPDSADQQGDQVLNAVQLAESGRTAVAPRVLVNAHSVLPLVRYQVAYRTTKRKEGRKEIFYLTMHSTHFLNIMWHWTLANDHSDSK